MIKTLLRLYLIEVHLCHLLTVIIDAWDPVKHRPEIFDEINTERICQKAIRYLYDHNRTRIDDYDDEDDKDNDDNDDDGKTSVDTSDVSVRVHSSNFTDGQPIKVSVSSNFSFVGLLLQGRWPGNGSNKTAGRFEASDSISEREGFAKTVTCGDEEDDTVIAWFHQGTTSQGFRWTPSNNRPDQVQFIATIFLSNYKTTTNVTFSYRIKGFPPIDHRTCGVLKGCFRYSSHNNDDDDDEEDDDDGEAREEGDQPCDANSCQYLLTYRVDGKEARFELSGRAGWVAVGFSSDDKMGGDDVFMCVRNRQQRVEVRRYLIELRHQVPTLVEHNPFYNMETEAGDGGRIHCRFTRPLTVKFDQTSVDLNAPWFQLYAWGPNSMGDDIMLHSLEKPPTSERKLTLKHSRNEIRHSGITGIRLAPCAAAWLAAATTALTTASFH